MLQMQKYIMDHARDILRHDDEAHIALHSKKVPSQFLTRSFVLVKYRGRGGKPQRPPTRLHTAWQGPLQVTNKNQSVYKLLDLVVNKEIEYHITD